MRPTFIVLVLPMLFATPALAQQGGHGTLGSTAFQLIWVLYIIGSMLLSYLFALLMVSLTMSTMYPPNSARLGCWIGLASFMVTIGVVSYIIILKANIPAAYWMVTGVIALLVGLLLLATRKSPKSR